MENNLILLTDSYKLSHYKQYPPGTETVYSYFESRGGEFDDTVFFGLQYLLNKYLSKKITRFDIEEAQAIAEVHMNSKEAFNVDGWQYILNEHNGYLPVRIKAVPEGSVVPTGNVLMTIENTDPKCYWLTNYLETLLVQVWYPTTVATVSRYMKQAILDGLKLSGDPGLIDFKLHDFGFRGVETVESAGIGGCAHLVNFQGTDTLEALRIARNHYMTNIAGYSIPASEHSTITSWGKENEVQAFKNMLDQWPTGLVACVSDSFDIYNACENLWGTELKDKILNRDGTLVVRPDSGNPEYVLPKILEILGNKFGYTTNSKGFKVLNPKIRIIQGDGVDRHSIHAMIGCLTYRGWSIDNIAFGSGGGLLQQVNRDTCKFAFKCSEITVNHEARPVYKQPIDTPWKVSKKGRLKLIKENNEYRTISSADMTKEEFDKQKDELREVFRNGTLTSVSSFSEIRERAKLE